MVEANVGAAGTFRLETFCSHDRSECACGLIVWLRPQFLYYPIAILSTGAIFVLLGMVYCLIWIIIFKKENSFEHYGEGLRFLLGGLATAVIQIGLLDLLRYSLTGTWQGFLLK